MTDTFVLANTELSSRLIVGTGKFASPTLMHEAVIAAETSMVTIAVRRVELENPQDSYLNLFNNKDLFFLPNTSGARNAEEAIRCAHIARAGSGSDWIKIEVIPEPHYLLPDPIETLKAAEQLAKDGFHVLPYMNCDPVLAKRLEDVGCSAVMPLASPIGTNKGIETETQLSIIIEQSTIPVIVDAGLGAPSHAAHAMECGADAVLVNTAIATAANPIEMAKAFKLAVKAGRQGYLAGLPAQSNKAHASSPLTGFLR